MKHLTIILALVAMVAAAKGQNNPNSTNIKIQNNRINIGTIEPIGFFVWQTWKPQIIGTEWHLNEGNYATFQDRVPIENKYQFSDMPNDQDIIRIGSPSMGIRFAYFNADSIKSVAKPQTHDFTKYFDTQYHLYDSSFVIENVDTVINDYTKTRHFVSRGKKYSINKTIVKAHGDSYLIISTFLDDKYSSKLINQTVTLMKKPKISGTKTVNKIFGATYPKISSGSPINYLGTPPPKISGKN